MISFIQNTYLYFKLCWNVRKYYNYYNEFNQHNIDLLKNITNSINNKNQENITVNDIILTCLEHIKLLEEHKSTIACVNLSKKHINYYLKNFKNSSLFRKKIMVCDKIDDIKNILNGIIK